MFPLGACIFLLSLAGAARADIQVDKTLVTLSTPTLEVTFQGTNLRSLKNKITGEESVKRQGPGWMDMGLQEDTGEMLTPSDWRIENDPAGGGQVAVMTAKDSVRTVTIKLGIDAASGDVTLRFSGASTKPGVRGIFFGLQGFDPDGGRFLIPGQAGIYFDEKTTPGALELQYPTHWEAQFTVYERAKGGILIYARDPRPYFKRLQASRQYGTLDIGLEVFAVAPWAKATSTPELEWRFSAYSGSWTNAVDNYRRWSDQALPSRQLGPSAEWRKDIRLVVTMIDTVIEYLDPLAARVDPSKTLIYLANWRKDPYDTNYPDYTPNDAARAFVKKAHELGFRVMLHANALGVAMYNQDYLKVLQYQLRDPDKGDLVYWPQGLWPAGTPPPFYIQSFAFISPCSPEYRALLIERLRGAVEDLKPDALHLDAGGVMLNDGNGLIEDMTSIEGMIRLHEDVDRAFPGMLFSYESMTEVLAGIQNFAQRWTASYPGHPIATYLMGDRVKFYGFLNQTPPEEPGFLDYITKYEAQGILPTYHIAKPKDIDGSQLMNELLLKLHALWQKYDFRPDWAGDWSNVIFRYLSADGSTQAVVEEKDHIVSLRVGEETIYQRVRGTTTVENSRFVPYWAAYDDTHIYGLDPKREYWLKTAPTRPTDRVRLSKLPENVVLGLGSFSGRSYGYFELDKLPRPTFDFLQKFSRARLGTSYNRVEVRFGYGSVVEITRTMVGGRVVGPALMMQPPYRLPGGVTFVEFPVDVPAKQPALKFAVGVSDFATGSDGVLLLARINGEDIWRQEIRKGALTPVSVDLARWAGQTVQLRLLAHAGPRLNTLADFAIWSDVSIEEAPDSAPVMVAASIPEPAPTPLMGSAPAAETPVNTRVIEQELGLPTKLVLFSGDPPEVPLNGTLIDLPFDRWRSGYGGWPEPSDDGILAPVQPGTSGGERVDRTIQTHPPSNGQSLVTWGVRLPADATRLEFRASLADPLPPLPSTIQYSITGFQVRINGEKVWGEDYQTNGWKDHSVDISRWAGKNVIIEISTDALGQGTFNWSQWTGFVVR